MFVVVVLVGVLFAFVFPTRSYYEQRRQIALSEHRLSVLREQNAALHNESQRLGSDAEVERLARSLYNLVKPGEQAYAVVPTPPAAASTAPPRVAVGAGTPNGKGHARAQAASGAWYRRVWHSIVGIL
jgi:type II secretory pathway pseudopilin PulG